MQHVQQLADMPLEHIQEHLERGKFDMLLLDEGCAASGYTLSGPAFQWGLLLLGGMLTNLVGLAQESSREQWHPFLKKGVSGYFLVNFLHSHLSYLLHLISPCQHKNLGTHREFYRSTLVKACVNSIRNILDTRRNTNMGFSAENTLRGSFPSASSRSFNCLRYVLSSGKAHDGSFGCPGDLKLF